MLKRLLGRGKDQRLRCGQCGQRLRESAVAGMSSFDPFADAVQRVAAVLIANLLAVMAEDRVRVATGKALHQAREEAV